MDKNRMKLKEKKPSEKKNVATYVNRDQLNIPVYESDNDQYHMDKDQEISKTITKKSTLLQTEVIGRVTSTEITLK
jgi:hypothetical protein